MIKLSLIPFYHQIEMFPAKWLRIQLKMNHELCASNKLRNGREGTTLGDLSWNFVRDTVAIEWKEIGSLNACVFKLLWVICMLAI